MGWRVRPLYSSAEVSIGVYHCSRMVKSFHMGSAFCLFQLIRLVGCREARPMRRRSEAGGWREELRHHRMGQTPGLRQLSRRPLQAGHLGRRRLARGNKFHLLSGVLLEISNIYRYWIYHYICFDIQYFYKWIYPIIRYPFKKITAHSSLGHISENGDYRSLSSEIEKK